MGEIGRIGVMGRAQCESRCGQIGALVEARVDARKGGQPEAADFVGGKERVSGGMMVRRREGGVRMEGGHTCKTKGRRFLNFEFCGN